MSGNHVRVITSGFGTAIENLSILLKNLYIQKIQKLKVG